jgi:hypothetical protein
MSVPIPGKFISDICDGYKFYLSHVGITIERAFGMSAYWFGILWRPMSISICKVPGSIACLMNLHPSFTLIMKATLQKTTSQC